MHQGIIRKARGDLVRVLSFDRDEIGGDWFRKALRATTAILDVGGDIRKAQDLLGQPRHRIRNNILGDVAMVEG